jgi:hypothetical protein
MNHGMYEWTNPKKMITPSLGLVLTENDLPEKMRKYRPSAIALCATKVLLTQRLVESRCFLIKFLTFFLPPGSNGCLFISVLSVVIKSATVKIPVASAKCY